MRIIILLSFFLWMACSEKTDFQVEDSAKLPTFCFGDVCDPKTPGEEICTINPSDPACIAYCLEYPSDPACSNTPVVNCETNPLAPGCYEFCKENPYHAMCGDPCDINPGSVECLAYCISFPNDPDCSTTVDCNDTPNHPACIHFCQLHPADPICTGIPDPVILNNTENFLQSTRNNKVDVLWVIDNSGSMADEQALLAENFSYFINYFANSSTDYQIGVVTTDVPNDNGLLQGTPKIIDSQTMTASQIISAFSQNVQVGIQGASIERGLKSSKIALTYAGLSGSYNFGFLRNDAFLAIIYVSDEDDSSSETTQSFIDYLSNIKGTKDFTNVYAIVDDQNYGCTGDPASGNAQTLGTRYLDVVNAVGGFSKSICTTNFASSLKNISKGVLKLINSFNLAKVPIQSTIQVWVNGTPVVNSYDSGFIYDDSTHSIVFMGSYIPPEGASIEVKYDYYNSAN